MFEASAVIAGERRWALDQGHVLEWLRALPDGYLLNANAV